METSQTYPYQDVVTPLLQGEVWKDIVGFEGSYQVSNLGRVRSLDRTVSHSRCGTQFVKGRILKQNLKKHYNHFKRDYIYIPQIVLMHENKTYYLIVRRLVFFTFNGWKISQKVHGIIASIDNNGLNCRLENLKLQTRGEQMQRLIKEDRTDFAKRKPPNKDIKPTFNLYKPVSRCSIEGAVIQTYPCIAHAAVQFSCYEKGISQAVKNDSLYRGFKWKLASREVLDNLISQYPKTKRIRKRRP
ncbi:MAG: hypothetical protein LBF27_10655 [Sphingobacterium sp.]|jgi:hypothetical protein|nr:hypothetical protein [Sphingobacterium sp.]